LSIGQLSLGWQLMVLDKQVAVFRLQKCFTSLDDANVNVSWHTILLW
jgi:hypothetical protein